MDLNFKKVTYDGELADFSDEELRELVREFESAQESNVAEFNEAAETLDEVEEAELSEFEDARSALIEEITDAEQFDEVPLDEEGLEDCSFGKLREWREFVASDLDEGEEGEEDDAEFDDMGQKGPVNPEDGEDFDDSVVEVIDGMSGVNIE